MFSLDKPCLCWYLLMMDRTRQTPLVPVAYLTGLLYWFHGLR
jgi:hypothetical protein